MAPNQTTNKFGGDTENNVEACVLSYDGDTELQLLVDEIISEQKSLPRIRTIWKRKPETLQLPEVDKLSVIDRHNMSLPSVPVQENARPLIFDATNKTVGKPFSYGKEVETIKNLQQAVPCSFCLTTKQAGKQAYNHTYSDKNGKVSCSLVLDFINRIHEQQQNSKDGSRAKTSKADIEVLLRKTLETSIKTKSLRSTWPSCSVSSSLNFVVPNNLNLILEKFSGKGRQSSPVICSQNCFDKSNQFTSQFNFNNNSDQKNEGLKARKTQTSLQKFLNESLNSKFSCSDENPFMAFNVQNSKIYNNSIFRNSTNTTELPNFLNSSLSESFNRSKTVDYDNAKEKLLNNSNLKAPKSVPIVSEYPASMELIKSESIVCGGMNDNWLSNSGSKSEDIITTITNYLQGLFIQEYKLKVSLCDYSDDYAGVNDIFSH